MRFIFAKHAGLPLTRGDLHHSSDLNESGQPDSPISEARWGSYRSPLFGSHTDRTVGKSVVRPSRSRSHAAIERVEGTGGLASSESASVAYYRTTKQGPVKDRVRLRVALPESRGDGFTDAACLSGRRFSGNRCPVVPGSVETNGA